MVQIQKTVRSRAKIVLEYKNIFLKYHRVELFEMIHIGFSIENSIKRIMKKNHIKQDTTNFRPENAQETNISPNFSKCFNLSHFSSLLNTN